MDNQEFIQVDSLDNYVYSNQAHIYGTKEWADPEKCDDLKKVKAIIKSKDTFECLEIGSGGGRWTRYLTEQSHNVVCCDATLNSLNAIARNPFVKQRQIKNFLLHRDGEFLIHSVEWSTESRMPYAKLIGGNIYEAVFGSRDIRFDAVFSFDTFVHFSQNTTLQYLKLIGEALKIGGTAIIHYAVPISPTGNDESFKYWPYESFPILAYHIGLLEEDKTLRIDFKQGYGSRLSVFKKIDPRLGIKPVPMITYRGE